MPWKAHKSIIMLRNVNAAVIEGMNGVKLPCIDHTMSA